MSSTIPPSTPLMLFLLQAAMWKDTVWPKLPPNRWERDQASKHDDALITVLWDQLVCLLALSLC